MIEVRNISRTFKNKSVLKKINFAIKENEVVFLSGPNGSGKTTLLKIISGLLKPSEGIVLFNGQSIEVHPQRWRRDLSFLPAEDNIFLPSLTGTQNIVAFNRFYGFSEAETCRKLDELAQFLPWHKVWNKKFGIASSGMKQKIKIAYAFSRPSKIILLDEPFRGLDRESRECFISFLYRHRAQRTIIFTDHSDTNLGNLVTHTLRLKEGALV